MNRTIVELNLIFLENRIEFWKMLTASNTSNVFLIIYQIEKKSLEDESNQWTVNPRIRMQKFASNFNRDYLIQFEVGDIE